MQELQVKAIAPKIEANFEQVKEALIAGVKKYDIVVTADTVKDAKVMATELNKLSKQIDSVRKEKVAEMKAPIDDFTAKINELKGICQDSRQKILDQVATFEAEQISLSKRLLAEYLYDKYNEQDVEEEFRKSSSNDLAMLSSLTASGNLTKKAKDEIDKRVNANKKLQDKVKMRILELENKSYKAGLKDPITQESIGHFLYAEDDAEYENRLQTLIKSELQRQERMQDRIRQEEEQKARQEAQKQIEQEREAFEQRQEVQVPKQESQPQQQEREVKVDDDGMRVYRAIATFEFKAKSVITNERIKKAIEDKLVKAGFESLKNLEVM